MHGGSFVFPLVFLLSGPLQLLPSEGDLAAKSQRGKQLMAGGRYAEAAALYRELVAAAPGNPGLLLNLGMALHMSGKDREAVAPLASALRLQPDLMPAALFLGAVQPAPGPAGGRGGAPREGREDGARTTAMPARRSWRRSSPSSATARRSRTCAGWRSRSPPTRRSGSTWAPRVRRWPRPPSRS